MLSIMGYIYVTIISVAVSVCAISLKRDMHPISTYIVFYIFTASITWVGEFIVLGLFNAYEYRTGLFEDIWAQNLLGYLLLNASMFPAAAITMVAFSLKYRYFALAAAVFVFIEYVFVQVGFYQQHWWRYYMSVINLSIFLTISGKWFNKMNQERHGLTRAIVFYFVSFFFVHLPAPILLLLGKQHYQLDVINRLFGNYYRSSILISFLYHLLMNSIYVFFVCACNKKHCKIIPFVLSAIGIISLSKMNILIIHEGWRLINYLIIQQLMVVILILFEKYTLKPIKVNLSLE